MGFRNLGFFFLNRFSVCSNHPHSYAPNRCLVKVRLKWVKNRGLDHIIDNETDLKAVCLLKDAIKRSTGGCLCSSTVSERQKQLGLTIPVLRFMRRYPTIFEEFKGSRYTVPWFRLTQTGLHLHEQEQMIHQTHELDLVERVCRLLMMTKTKTLPFLAIEPLKWDLGLPDDFVKSVAPKYPEHFRIEKQQNGRLGLRLVQWREEFAVSSLQRKCENSEKSSSYRNFKRGISLAFPMSFPRGYGSQKKVIAWMDEFQKLPYISPYEDSSQIDPESDLMEKRVVGVLHELLSITIHRKTKRNYLRSLREELSLPHKFTRVFTRYPGIFYLSLKCKTTTVALKEAYQRGKLVDPHPLARIRDKYFYVMRTGVMYRGKGLELISPSDGVTGSVGIDGRDPEEELSEVDIEMDGECYDSASNLQLDSSEDDS